MKFYILCHRGLEHVKRHVESIPIEDQVVVINSLDNDFIDQTSAYCRENSIEHYITESDGTPAMGKNSVMKLFLESDNEYMVQVDGDDQITKYGYFLYTSVAKSHNPPDIICLREQWSYILHKFFPDEHGGVKKAYEFIRCTPWTRTSGGRDWMENVVRHYGELKAHEGNKDVDWRIVKEWAEDRVKFEKFFWEFGNGTNKKPDVRETFNRMVFYSRKAAKLVDFTISLEVGEDVMEFLRLKHLARNGEINMVSHMENPAPSDLILTEEQRQNWESGICYSYMYWQRDFDGTVNGRVFRDGKKSYNWMGEVIEHIKERGLEEKYESIRNWNLPEMNRPDSKNPNEYEYVIRWS